MWNYIFVLKGLPQKITLHNLADGVKLNFLSLKAKNHNSDLVTYADISKFHKLSIKIWNIQPYPFVAQPTFCCWSIITKPQALHNIHEYMKNEISIMKVI